jgi:hypothetical protein
VAIWVAAVLGGCGGQTTRSHSAHAPQPSRHRSANGSGGQQSSRGTSLASDVIAYLFPRSGADWAVGLQVLNFKIAQVDKAETACMAADGLPGPPTEAVPLSQFGTAELPNLPVIERTLSIGVTETVASPKDPTHGMSSAEAAAYQAALTKCSANPHKSLTFLSSGPTDALRGEWSNITDAVVASGPVQRLNQQATQCAARTTFPADSVQNEEAEIARQVNSLQFKNDGVAARSTEIAGSRVLVRCFEAEVNLTDQLLTRRRTEFFAANAQAIDQIEGATDRAVAGLGAK